MQEVNKHLKLSELETYIFVDVSNIRAACLKTLGFKINFSKCISYWKKKYPALQVVRYYEGIANNDTKKQAEFTALEKAGYQIRSLERKTYTEPPVYREVQCQNCKAKHRVQILKKSIKLKSNVDVYLATELLEIAFLATKPLHIILVACDGDYAEMIKRALDVNKNVYLTVVATPVMPPIRLPNGKLRNINSCSTRLQALKSEKNPHFNLTDIRDIRDYIQE